MTGMAACLQSGWSRLGRCQVPAVTAVVVLAVTLTLGGDSSVLSMSVQVAVTTLIAVSFGMAYGLGGVLSAAQAAFAACGAYLSAIVTAQAGWPLPMGLAVAVLLPAAVGYVLVRLVGGLSHMVIGLATLTLGQIFTTAISHGGHLTGGYVGLSGIPPLPGWLSTPLGSHVLAWLSVLVVVWLYANLSTSTQGSAFRAIAFDETLARTLGVPVARNLGALLALSGGMAGYAGWLFAHTNSFVSPESLPVQYSITVFLMVIVGGRRSIAGPLIGAVGLSLLSYYLPGGQIQGIVYGLALVAAMLLFPYGVTSVVHRIGPVRRGVSASEASDHADASGQPHDRSVEVIR